MGLLTEPELDAIVQAGCATCGTSQLGFHAYLDGRMLLLGGEPVSKLTWCYDGEKFVDGVYEIRCGGCSGVLFSAGVCPRCNQEGGLAHALAAENRFPRLAECPQCGAEELRYTAMLPAVVTYERKRAAAPRAQSDPYEPGFHGYKVSCEDCGDVAEQSASCPLCAAPGPLRARPG